MNELAENKEEVIKWYLHIQAHGKSGLNGPEYCRQNGLKYKDFSNKSFRINYKKNRPEQYAECVDMVNKFEESGLTRCQFSIKYKVSKSVLSETITHLRCKEIIEEYLSKEEPMKLIQITPKIVPCKQPEPEVVEKQNDIEIQITKGVKVSISPNIDSMKIIKIIELLKDL